MRVSLIFLLTYHIAGSNAVFIDQPKIQTVDGHLFIYGAMDKNVSFMTTSNGYINVNDENLYNIVQDAKKAAKLFKNVRATSFNKMEDDIKNILSVLEQYNQRMVMIEGGTASKTKDKSYFPMLTGLNGRVKKLERKVRIISRNLARNECRRDPCLNGGTCLDRYLGYECRCPEGWEGKKCEKDVNECAKFAGTDLGCQNGATCVNKKGSYECHCAPGWYGLHCLKRTHDCNSASAAELCGNGVCVSQPNSPVGYTCICSQGWKTDGVSQACTVDVDECSTSPCSRNPPVLCHNSPGSFFCGPCPPGYTGNGYQCSDVNECLVDNGGCSVQPMVTCINTQGSSTCGSCPPGYSGDGKTCIFVGKCQVDNGGCNINAMCIEVGSNVQCQCRPGYTGHGIGPFGCQPQSGPITPNPCQPNPCLFGGACVPSSGSNFTCYCLPGFTGATCNVPRSCDSNPCQNGGTCEMKGSSFRCKCPSQFTGTYCEEQKEACGRYLKSDEGILKYPDGARTTTDVNCAWNIRVNVTKVINITFQEFDLRNSYECQIEWLEIHDGRSTGDVTIGKFCGKQPPNNGTILTTQNNVYIWFKSFRSSNTKFQLKWSAVDPVCGGAVDASVHGVITSPGYPGKYPHNRDCYWEVTAPIGKRIMFTIFEIRLKSFGTCEQDYLEVHEGIDVNSPLIVKFCNTTPPEIFETTGNVALVYFHSDHRGSEKGFQIAYHPKPGHPGCGGIFTTLRGEFSPPTRNNVYLPNLDCAWVIRLPQERRIQVEFDSFSVQNSRVCRNDYVEIRDGGDISAPLLGKFCGYETPPPIMSNSKILYVRFYSDDILESTGFVLRYRSVCDETFTADSGIIKSPGYPETYKSEEECVMLISLPLGKSIILDFQEFEIESTFRCMFDYLEIRDGHGADSPLIGRYCGGRIPGKVVSTYNYLYLKMVTDKNVELGGFYANYSSIDSSCGGILTEPFGIIDSPVEGSHYPSNSDCKWVIAVKPGNMIQLTFNKFKVEGFSGCKFDYVAIYDNSTSLKGNNLIGKYCNLNMPPVVTSTENVMTIVFHSDASFTDEGFTASYTSINASTTCGGKYFTEWGTIRTPNFPDPYPNGLNCVWVIQVATGHKINLDIKDFALERPYRVYHGRTNTVGGANLCKFDYLEIRDGGYSNSPLIGRYCGNDILKKITSQSNSLYLEFVSDFVDSARGFRINWDGSIKGCGGTLSGFTGSVISPNYPERYGAILNCVYKISVSHGSKIKLNFVDLDLDVSKDCKNEYIEVLDGPEIHSNPLAKVCSFSEVAQNLISSKNHVTINFKSGIRSVGKGFYIKYFTVCRTNITGYRGSIESPNYPYDFPSGLDCEWIIKAPMGNKVSVSFTDFNLKGSCRDTYVEARESKSSMEYSRLIGKYCKHNQTQTIQSSMEWLYLKLVTSEKQIGGNIRLEWAVNGCGGLMTKPTGMFTSPNYPNLYPLNTECNWWITVEPWKSINLVISDISMERYEVCDMDSLEVYGGPDATAPLLTKLCSVKKEPVTVSSSGNNMYIVFKSDASNVGRGFKAVYTTSRSACGGLFTADSGSIHSKNYPKNYDLDDCEWTIKVEKNHRINLTFTSFDLSGTSGNCSSVYVEVYDGPNIFSPAVWRNCGTNLPDVPTVISTSNTLTVRMKVSNTTFFAKGFLANYNMICGGVINADVPGILNSENLMGMPMVGTNCTWLLTSSRPDGHIILTLSHVSLGLLDEPDSCYVSYLNVFDGSDENSTLVGTYCANNSPLPIVSQGNRLLLRLVFGWSTRDVLQASYTTVSSSCGGDLSSDNGVFASPNYPSSYPPDSECVWVIRTAPGNKIQLRFKIFDIGQSESCNDEYLEIRDASSTGTMIGVYCGTDSPSNLTAHNSLWIKFRSSRGGTGTMRFLAEYSLVFGNELNGTSGQIANPGYPRPCTSTLPQVTWRISVGFTNFVQIDIKELHMDSVGTFDCSSSLTIYDGYDETAPVLSKLCDAQVVKEPIVSSSNVVFITFICDLYNLGSLFFLEWRETSTRNAPAPAVPTSTPVPGCGGDVALSSRGKSSVTIVVPAYNQTEGLGSLDTEIKCIWRLTAPEDEHLSVKMLSVNLDSFFSCDYTHIEIATLRDGQWKPVFMICNDKETNRTIHGNSEIRITYFHKWALSFSPATLQVQTECGSSIRKSNGIITFDWRNYSSGAAVLRNPRSGKALCQWDITVSSGRTIQAVFLEMYGAGVADPSENKVCRDYYVSLRNGGTEESPYLGNGVYCSAREVVPQTTSNRLYIKFLAGYQFYGFKLKFEEVQHDCGGRFTLTEEFFNMVIISPNYPNVPPMKIECIWRFVAVGVRRLQIDFLDRFDLTHSPDCSIEYVSVRDGGTELANELGRFCSEKPGTLETTGNMMYVRYFTNTTDPKNGFRAKVSLDRCGGVITSSTGVITSPGYPNTFPYHTKCEWHIESSLMSTILKINFEDIDLPYDLSSVVDLTYLSPFASSLMGWSTQLFSGTGQECASSAHVIVTEPAVANSTGAQSEVPLAFICSNAVKDQIQTSKNKAVISFDSGNWEVGHYFQQPRGFKLNFTSARGGCLYKLYTESGSIISPERPIGQLGYYNCEWRITVPPGRRITVTFDYYHVPWNPKSLQLTAYNDHSYRSLIGSLVTKSGTPVDQIKSTSNMMTINFISPYVPGHSSFKLSYTSDEPAACGGNVSNSEGELYSPKNLSSFYCDWFFTKRSKQNQTLSLMVYDSIIGNRTGTCSSRFGSFLGFRFTGELWDHSAVLCGNVSSRTIRTPYTRGVLTGLKSHRFFGDVDFKVKYRISECGGVLSGTDFVITSPNYPSQYPNNIDCAWVIELPYDSTVKLTFEDYLLDEKDPCADYLIVRNGDKLDSPIVNHLCSDLPTDMKPILSEASSILIEFHSNEANAEKGFRIKVEPSYSTCGGVIHSEDTRLSSPNFPSSYENNQECEWEIHTLEGMHIGLVFVERFHIEDSPNCSKDYVKVFDYVNGDWKLLKRVCGREFPAPINSTSNRMKVVFHSDDSVVSDGFQAKWNRNCGARFGVNTSGKIISPGYPNQYPSDIRCEYYIKHLFKDIMLNFSYFNLEKDTRGSCLYDSVEVLLETAHKEYSSHKKFCGNTLPSPMLLTRNVKIVFVTDAFANFNGFVLNFGIGVCGGLVTEPTEISFIYDGTTRFGYQECVWNITAPQDKIIALRFSRLNLASSTNCKNYALRVTEKDSKGVETNLAQLCGYLTKNLPTIRSRGGNLTLRLQADMSVVNRGFAAHVSFTYGPSQGCGGNLNLNSNPETILSPDIDRDGKYDSNLDCNWMIFAKPFHYITAHFLSFDMDNCNSSNATSECFCDFVELRNGLNPSSDVLLRACGGSPPADVVSSNNVISLRMVTNSIHNRKGFSVQFSSVLSECGYGILNATNEIGIITSPNYPDKYPMGIRCKWVITDRSYNPSKFFKALHVHVVEWDLGGSEDCSGDTISIRNTGGIHSKNLDPAQRLNSTIYVVGKSTEYYGFDSIVENDKVLCGKGKSLDYYSQTNEISIDFVSRGAAAKKGFKIEYMIAGCARNYSSDHGQILVHDVKANEVCVIVIEAPKKNQTLSLYFLQVNMFYTDSNCTGNYVEVRDGPSGDSPLMERLCGYSRPNPFFSTGRYLTLIARSKKNAGMRPYVIENGFDLVFTATDKGRGCGGRVSAMKGVIYSPEYKKNVRRNSMCRWDVSVPKDMEIVLKFPNFDVGPANTCESDYLEIYDVSAEGSENLRARFCGGSNPGQIRSQSSGLAIKYKTSVHNGGTGWEIEYAVVLPGSTNIW